MSKFDIDNLGNNLIKVNGNITFIANPPMKYTMFV